MNIWNSNAPVAPTVEASDEHQAAWQVAWKIGEVGNAVVLDLKKWSWAPGIYQATLQSGGEPRTSVFRVFQGT
jgi:hypothetical protein